MHVGNPEPCVALAQCPGELAAAGQPELDRCAEDCLEFENAVAIRNSGAGKRDHAVFLLFEREDGERLSIRLGETAQQIQGYPVGVDPPAGSSRSWPPKTSISASSSRAPMSTSAVP